MACSLLLLTAVEGVRRTARPRAGSPRGEAALLDSLAIEFPNPQLEGEIREALGRVNLSLDVYTHWNVSVDLYRRLPTLGYRLVVFRVHTAAYYREGVPVHVALGTGEPYSPGRYVDLQVSKRLGALVLLKSDDRYFAVPPEFVRHEMEGGFDGAVLILPGCAGLITNVTAQALVDRGASVVIGWDGDVSVSHSDAAAAALVRLLADGKTVEEAVNEVMRTLGPDPQYGSRLLWYPRDAGGVRLEGSGAGIP